MHPRGLALLPEPELQSMRLDGEVTTVGPPGHRRYVAIDEPRTPAQRAGALAPLMSPGAVLERASAAWVHDGLAPPRTIEIAVPRGRRRHDDVVGARYREVVLPTEHCIRLGDVEVTDVQRTLADLARAGAPAHRIRALARLTRVRPDELAGALEILSGNHGSRAGRARLEAAVRSLRRP